MKLYLSIAILLFISGCDIFQTREPEKPITGRSSYTFPATPELVVQNIANSLKEKNLQDYMSCFVDSAYSQKSYRFIATPGATARYSFFSKWTLKSEESYFNNVISKLSSTEIIDISITKVTAEAISADSVQYIWQYSLQIPRKNASAMKYDGQMRFTMIPDNRSAWVISTWDDIKADNGSGWSDLKGENY